MNRIWQCGTIQLDMQLPGRFDCTYITKDGGKATPVMIHRACFGSIERFIGIITENYGGNFPLWLAPEQIRIIPVNEVHMEASKKLCDNLKALGFRATLDDRNEEKLGYKIREAQTKKIPYQLVIGDKEANLENITYRRHGEQNQVTVSYKEFIDMIKKQVPDYKGFPLIIMNQNIEQEEKIKALKLVYIQKDFPQYKRFFRKNLTNLMDLDSFIEAVVI